LAAHGHHHSGNERKPSARINSRWYQSATSRPIFTGFDFYRHGFGNCFSATRRTLRAACLVREEIVAHCLRRTNFTRRSTNFAAEIDAVEFLHQADMRVSAGEHRDNLRAMFSFCIMPGAHAKVLLDRRRKSHDAHQSTILFKGYSTIPWALAA